MTKKNKEFLHILFDEYDLICAGDLYDNGVSRIDEVEAAPFVCVNPLLSVDLEFKKKEERRYNVSRRSDVNVKSLRNFMFEMDDVSLDKQLQILHQSGIPFSSIVYSGGKSYHAVLSLETPLEGAGTLEGIKRYKHIWSRLAAKIGDEVDPSGKNPSRLTRMAGSDRDGVEQRVHSLGKRISMQDFEQLLQDCPVLEFKQSVAKNDERKELEGYSIEHFLDSCPTGLRNEILFPLFVTDANNYSDMFRLSRWAKDSTDVDFDLFCKVVEKYIVPKMVSVGYPEEKFYVGVEHAFGV